MHGRPPLTKKKKNKKTKKKKKQKKTKKKKNKNKKRKKKNAVYGLNWLISYFFVLFLTFKFNFHNLKDF